MKKFVLMALSLSFLSLCFGKDFTLSPQSYIGFDVKKFGVKTIKGYFKDFSGKLTLTDKHITALSGEMRIESIFTDSTKRDKHLQEEDFLDSAKFPKSEFILQSYEPLSDSGDTIKGKGKVQGTLTLHNVSLPLVLESSLESPSSQSPRLALTGKINTKDYGIKGSFLNSDEVKIILQTQWQ
ncbi:YceI family protein [uncultured Helicobacter sp.]|uniref:YceI family protein n=1 Tax=uncultured Helicobacter sp. TaxID=175537 RepID=UPI0025F25DF4|nr:YceI family protein [uncultured Helicobacter sp.]